MTRKGAVCKFKVGDIVRWRHINEPPEIDRNKSYEVIRVGGHGVIDLKGVRSSQWFPENFELDKNSIVHDLLKDL